MLVAIYKTIRRHIPEDRILDSLLTAVNTLNPTCRVPSLLIGFYDNPNYVLLMHNCKQFLVKSFLYRH
jgi:hypothetical protein